ncbi:MAG: DCC1-like thiol-disulfide oxidoreductase family protein [Lentisphaeraceae bacterium]|nr:DCC1-like thiol-disulfide oxidoreductase family protein [Lentisphaeraceae bacterium]
MKWKVEDDNQPAIVLFDGDCNFCNNSVNFIIKHDPKAIFHFCPQDSKSGQEIITTYFPDKVPDSLILVADGEIKIKSKAALSIAKKLTFPWNIASVLRILPAFILDPIYDIVAKNRHKLVKNKCMIPSADIRDRFIS